MRKLIMKMNLTIDGFVGGPKGEADWIFSTGDDESRAWALAMTKEAGLVIMGRKTFEIMASYWPTAPGPMATVMNEIPKAVFTKSGFKAASPAAAGETPSAASWTSARIFDGDLAEGIKILKAEEGKPIYAAGGAEFMRSLINTGLIDEFQLCTHPVLLGTGLPIFTELVKPTYLKLAAVKSFPGGVVVHTYRPA